MSILDRREKYRDNTYVDRILWVSKHIGVSCSEIDAILVYIILSIERPYIRMNIDIKDDVFYVISPYEKIEIGTTAYCYPSYEEVSSKIEKYKHLIGRDSSIIYDKYPDPWVKYHNMQYMYHGYYDRDKYHILSDIEYDLIRYKLHMCIGRPI